MKKLKLLIVEGNTKEENINFNNAGCVPQSQNFKFHVNQITQNCEIDIVEPGNDKSVSKILSSLNQYNGVILTGSTLRIEDLSEEVKKHIDFVKRALFVVPELEKELKIAIEDGLSRKPEWQAFQKIKNWLDF